MNTPCLWRRAAALCALLCVGVVDAQTHSFSVQDDIGIVRFGNVWGQTRDSAVKASPDGQWLCVHTVGASLKDDRVHDQLRLYRQHDLLQADGERFTDVHPAWIIEGSVVPKGQIDAAFLQVQWTRNGRLAYLRWTDAGSKQLILADVSNRRSRALTDVTQDVVSFAVSDEMNYVYTTPAEDVLQSRAAELERKERIVGDHQNVYRMLNPELVSVQLRADLWSVKGGLARRIVDPASHRPLRILGDGTEDLSLSPDGKWIATIRPYTSIPEAWVVRYRPPFPDGLYRLKPGTQDIDQPINYGAQGEYVAIDRSDGSIVSLAHGPIALRINWLESVAASVTWSPDGRHVFLPATFSDRSLTEDNRPCSTVVDMRTLASSCMRPSKRNLARSREDGYARIAGARFLDSPSGQVAVEIELQQGTAHQFQRFTQGGDGSWVAGEITNKPTAAQEFRVVQDAQRPPVLVRSATIEKGEDVIFDPNPQLRSVNFGKVEEYHWGDGDHQWSGLLFRPLTSRPGRRSPLVIQTHGYNSREFMPSGSFQSAFVAQELAAVGILVLQVEDCAERSTVTELPCNVLEYESAVQHLLQDANVDPSRVGVIGFSRTVSYVMKALVSSKVRFAAASVTDGINVGYVDYMLNVGGPDVFLRDENQLVGGAPVGSGMAAWLKNSPEFNSESIWTPLRVVSGTGSGILDMWEPYARLKLEHRPAEMVVLNTTSHVIAQPSIRLVAQQGNVDWFRFWLQDFVDVDPKKTEQYQRWEKLRTMQDGTLPDSGPPSGDYSSK